MRAKQSERVISIRVPTIAGKIPSKTLCFSKRASTTFVSEKINSKDIASNPLKTINDKRK